MRIIFAGTPDFAATAFACLLKTSHEIVAVYTQPDRKSGRGQKLMPSPVKELAEQHNIPVYQPLHFKSSTEEGLFAQKQLADLNADIMVVAAYGLILPQVILDTPKYGCLNIHASLLPRWRGAAPIQRAIQAGDSETGVTIMQMAAGLDTGDMMLKTLCPIEIKDTSASLHQKLATQGAEAIATVLKSESSLKDFLENRIPQDEKEATYAHKLNKTDAQINWNISAEQIHRDIRAFTPWPTSYIFLEKDDIRIRVLNADLVDEKHQNTCGTILRLDTNGIHVACGDNSVICIKSLQWSGGKPLTTTQILQTQKLKAGQLLI